MAQKYNPATGQWEEDEEDTGSLSGGLSSVFGGSSPEIDGSAMAAGTPQFSNGSFNNPQYNLGNLPSGYGWEAPEGSTKKYANDSDTFFDYLGKDGSVLGRGYDDYDTAITKVASRYSLPTESDTAQQSNPYKYESFEKYGRPLTEGQLQNMYAVLSSPYGENMFKQYGGIPDWTYHRAAYEPAWNPIAGMQMSGDAAMVGSTPLFGSDGKILGYKSSLNPEHYNFADTSGRVQSSSGGSTGYSPEVASILQRFGDNTAFINAGDVSKYGYTSKGGSTYDKAPTTWEKLGKAGTLAFLGTVAGGAAGFGPAAEGGSWSTLGAGGAELTEGLGGAELLGEAGGYGFTSGELAGAMPELLGGGGLGLEGLPGAISDIGSWVGDAGAMGGADPGVFSNLGDMINGLDPSAFGGADVVSSMGDMASPAMEAGTSSISPEMFGPPQASDLEGLFLDDWGGGTNAMGEFTNGRGMLAPQDRIAASLRQLGMERETAANLTQGGSKMYNFMTQSPGKAGMFKAPSPLEMLYKGGKAFMDYNSNKDAMGMYEDQLNKVRSYQDPNRARGDTANQLWQQNFQDPKAGYQDFMMGGGRDFIDQARAQAAKSGKRGSYINSGKMNSDLASMYMKQQLARGDSLTRGFANSPNNAENTMKYMAPMMDMERNKYAPFGQAIDSIMRGFQLSDLFGG